MRHVRRTSARAGILLGGLLVIGPFAGTALADTALQEGRSASTCSNDTLVCAFMTDGSSRPTSECAARRDGAARILPGDCYDPD